MYLVEKFHSEFYCGVSEEETFDTGKTTLPVHSINVGLTLTAETLLQCVKTLHE